MSKKVEFRVTVIVPDDKTQEDVEKALRYILNANANATIPMLIESTEAYEL